MLLHGHQFCFASYLINDINANWGGIANGPNDWWILWMEHLVTEEWRQRKAISHMSEPGPKGGVPLARHGIRAMRLAAGG